MTIQEANKLSAPRIVKANSIQGKTLVFKNVERGDAEFILSLRQDTRKSKHLSKTSASLSDQKKWIENYANSDNQAYFIITHKDERIGTVRLYDPVDDSFCWGSWMLNDNAPMHAAIESTLIVYTYAFKVLGFNRSHFDVRKENKKVCKFHERFGATLLSQGESDYFYSIDKIEVFNALERYKKYFDVDILDNQFVKNK